MGLRILKPSSINKGTAKRRDVVYIMLCRANKIQFQVAHTNIWVTLWLGGCDKKVSFAPLMPVEHTGDPLWSLCR
jgi:hypothetical protein